MKTIFRFIWLLLCLVPSLRAQTVEQWGIFETSLKGPSGGNPFMEVQFSATFSSGTYSHAVEGFYDGDGIYRVRFMPEVTGTWHYRTTSNRPELSGSAGAFVVSTAGAGNHGPVRVFNTYHFAYADGTPYRELGTTSYCWAHQTDALEDETLKTLAASPFNKIRMCILPRDDFSSSPPQMPFPGTPPKNWDYTRFNPVFFQQMEKRVGQLRDLGIEADLILLHPYAKGFGFSTMAKDVDERYMRYVVARFGCYRNVWWSLANEYDFLKTKKDSDWDSYFQVVAASDPYGHLRSIHNGSLIYNNNQPWVTHASIQNGSAVEEPGRAELYRDVWRKPVVYDEVKYEGNIERRWGQLTGEEMVDRFWAGTVAGTYVGHSECLKNSSGQDWLAGGGTLVGTSPVRLAFLKKILDDSPVAGIEPCDKWEDSDMGGQPGKYYLLYFGRKAPTSWTFRLYKDGISEGMRFKVDVLDTWNMTVTPVPGEFVAKKKDNYYFVDAQGGAVKLPANSWLALRIRSVASALTNSPAPVVKNGGE